MTALRAASDVPAAAPRSQAVAARKDPPPGSAGGAAGGWRRRLWLYGVIAVMAIALGLARLGTGPWFHVYNPRELILIDGRPVSWEATYYTDHLPTFESRQRPSFGISAVHQRTLLPLFLAAQLYAWSGGAFWSFAAVDLFFWGVAGIATYHLALRLGAGPWPAALGALLTTASPVLVSHMWRHDLHTANFAGLPIGLWAAMVLVDEPRPRWQLSAGLAVLLLLLSLSYQYQWLMVPLVVVLCATQPRVGLRWGVAVVAAALLLFVGATVASEALFRLTVGDPTAWTGAVVHPLSEVLSRLAGARTVPQALAAVITLAPKETQLLALLGAYHPLVLLAGVAGAARMGRRMMALLFTGLVVALFSHTMYEAPWTAALCYPLVYAGAGMACAVAGAAAARGMALIAGRAMTSTRMTSTRMTSTRMTSTRMTSTRMTSTRRLGREWVSYGAALAVALACAAVTNLDLVGNPSFALAWWRAYSTMHSQF